MERAAIFLRKAEIDDFECVYKMISDLENEAMDKDFLLHSYKQNLANKDVSYWLAVSNEQPIGFISLHVQNLLHRNGPVAEIQELFVDSEFRGAHIGQRLVETAREEAIKRGCKRFEVSTNVKREGAHRFYERLGMQRTHLKFTQTL
ncbi:MAG TPA: GNAT family N-acetyltransferase [Candidatus Paceibacterota bacterium]